MLSWIVKHAHSIVCLLFLAKAHPVPGSPACESLDHSPHTVIEIEGETVENKKKKTERNVDINVAYSIYCICRK